MIYSIRTYSNCGNFSYVPLSVLKPNSYGGKVPKTQPADPDHFSCFNFYEKYVTSDLPSSFWQQLKALLFFMVKGAFTESKPQLR